MEILFIILSLACQAVLLVYSGELFLGEKMLFELFGVSFTGRGMMALSTAFMVLALLCAILRRSKVADARQEAKKLKEENTRVMAEKYRLEVAAAKNEKKV